MPNGSSVVAAADRQKPVRHDLDVRRELFSSLQSGRALPVAAISDPRRMVTLVHLMTAVDVASATARRNLQAGRNIPVTREKSLESSGAREVTGPT